MQISIQYTLGKSLKNYCIFKKKIDGLVFVSTTSALIYYP